MNALAPVVVGADDYAAADDWLVDWDMFAGAAVRESLAEAFAARAARVLPPLADRPGRPSAIAAAMRACVAADTGVSAASIAGASQGRLAVRARDAVAWAISTVAGLSHAEIGRITDRDPSSITVALARAEARRADDPDFRALTDRLRVRFTEGEQA